MASKQLGKLRQWAGEVISSRDKATVSEEFKELEKDIELRKDGAHKLHTACEAYHHSLSKKKQNEGLDEADKLLPVDALGIVMIIHGEQFGGDSQFGTSLVNLGRAHCKVATLQDAYALTFKDTFISAIEKFRDEIKEYEALRKKLDSRRLSLDAAATKVEKLKNSKREKDKREAQDEFERAQQRYEETVEDMRAHMYAIQENEIGQQRELTSFLDLEINFVHQYLDVLKDVKAEWPDRPRRTEYRDDATSNATRNPSSSWSHRYSQPVTQPVVDSSEDEDASRSSVSRGFMKHKTSGSTASSRAPSRPSSRLSRKRTNSTAASSAPEGKEKEEKSRRSSVAGWASSAVESVTSRGKRNKDKESFSALDDNAHESANVADPLPPSLTKSGSFSLSRATSLRKKSKENLPAISPKVPPRILKPPSLQDKKVVWALYDFNGSADELSFRAGSEIVVLNEVLDDWWMGETNGRKGLFPTSYVSTSPTKPGLPYRPAKKGNMPLLEPAGGPQYATTHEESGTSDLEEFHHQPLAHNRSPFYGGFNDVASITSSHHEEDDIINKTVKATRRFSDDLDLFMDQPKFTPRRRSVLLNNMDPANQPLINRTQSDVPYSTSSSNSAKKAPPPPPPRRPSSQTASPAIPERRLPPSLRNATNPLTDSTESVPSFPTTLLPPSMTTGGSGGHYDTSPFESAAELSISDSDGPNVCGQFRQNPFQPKGMCSNCRQFHS